MSKKPGKCHFRVIKAGDSERYAAKFPVSEDGWTKALGLAENHVFVGAKESYLSLACGDGPDEHILIAKCETRGSKQPQCKPIPSGNSNTVLANSVLSSEVVNKTKKPRRKIPKSQQSPAQLRFAKAAASCKGTPGKGGYRTCMARTLSGLKKKG